MDIGVIMIIHAFDPGETTGTVTVDIQQMDDGYVMHPILFGEIEYTKMASYLSVQILPLLEPTHIIAVEQFIIYPGGRASGWDQAKTSQLIGQIKALAQQQQCGYVEYMPAITKRTTNTLINTLMCSDVIIPKSRHIRDAFRVAITHVRKTDINFHQWLIREEAKRIL